LPRRHSRRPAPRHPERQPPAANLLWGRRAYRELLTEGCKAAKVDILAYCLMPNPVHLVLTPSSEDGLRAVLADAHRRYSRRINQREGWTGYLWQGRFASAPLDEAHLLAACRYVELNPVRARIVAAPRDWSWSTARAHLNARPDGVASIGPMLTRVPDWAGFLAAGLPEADHLALRAAERTGRPLGSKAFIAGIETRSGRSFELGRAVRPRRPADGASDRTVGIIPSAKLKQNRSRSGLPVDLWRGLLATNGG
jgi:putative transposase